MSETQTHSLSGSPFTGFSSTEFLLVEILKRKKHDPHYVIIKKLLQLSGDTIRVCFRVHGWTTLYGFDLYKGHPSEIDVTISGYNKRVTFGGFLEVPDKLSNFGLGTLMMVHLIKEVDKYIGTPDFVAELTLVKGQSTPLRNNFYNNMGFVIKIKTDGFGTACAEDWANLRREWNKEKIDIVVWDKFMDKMHYHIFDIETKNASITELLEDCRAKNKSLLKYIRLTSACILVLLVVMCYIFLNT